MYDKCPHCNEGDIVEDDIGSEVTKICTNCGLIPTNSISFQTSSEEWFEGSGGNQVCLEKKYGVKVGKYKRTPRLQVKVLEKVKQYLSRFSNSEVLYEMTKEMFQRLVNEDDKWFMANRKRKFGVAAACTIHILRTYGNNVLIKEVAEGLEIHVKIVTKAQQKFNSIIETHTPHIQMDSLVDRVCSQLPSTKDRTHLWGIIKKFCHMFADLYLSTGYHRVVTIHIAAYYAFKGENVRSSMTFEAFCSINKLPRSSNYATLKKLVQDKLILLAERLPWTRGKVKPNRIQFYLKDILQTKNALMVNKQSLNNERDSDDDDSDVSCENESLTTGNNHTLMKKKQSLNDQKDSDGDDFDVPCEREPVIAEKDEPIGNNQPPRAEKDQVIITDQMRLEAPIALIRNLKSKKPEISPEHFSQVEVSESTNLSEADIRDEDLGEYIRSNEEINIMKHISKKLQQKT